MKTIYFIKTLKYDPSLEDHTSRYKGYCLSTLQISDPSLLSENQNVDLKNINYNKIFSSTLKRASQTSDHIKNNYNLIDADVESLHLCNEVLFDLNDLVSELEFNRFGSDLVRERFVDAFINNKLKETLQDLKLRSQKLHELIKNLDEGNYIIVSHSFFMKIFEAFLKEDNFFEKPYLIRKYIKKTKKTFDFGCGFTFDM